MLFKHLEYVDSKLIELRMKYIGDILDALSQVEADKVDVDKIKMVVYIPGVTPQEPENNVAFVKEATFVTSSTAQTPTGGNTGIMDEEEEKDWQHSGLIMPQDNTKRQGAANPVLKIMKSFDDEYIIYGLASTNILDKQGHVITLDALREAVPRFMANEQYRNVMVFHLDTQIGEVIPEFVAKSGLVYRTEVDDRGWWIVCKLRKDIEVARNTIMAIEKGELNGFSIAGNATDYDKECDLGGCHIVIKSLEIYEISVCQIPVQSEAHFIVVNRGLDDCQNCRI